MVFRKRLVYWLLKEYLKKWGKTFLFFFFIGLVVFFSLRVLFAFYKPTIPQIKKESIGLAGAYSADALPPVILEELSRGLTKVTPDGTIHPDVASSWKIKNNGKTYIFTLKKNIYFSNGKKVTSDLLTYNFSDAKVEKPDSYTIIFRLKDAYTPFLVTVSKPILLNGSVGIGHYKIKNLKLNGNFVQSIDLVSVDNAYDIKSYQFYPTSDSLKTAFLLGEITTAQGLYDDTFRNTPFAKFPRIHIQKKVNTNQLATLFFNTKDTHLSSRDIRTGLTYALPDTFTPGQRTYTFYPPTSWAYTPQYNYARDLENAKLLTRDLSEASKSASVILSVKVLPKYKHTAEEIAKEWEKIGIASVVEVVETVPSDFQIFLGDFNLPKDPDQYMIWHSGQENNITKYESKRIDKLLEDGRKTKNGEQRKKIYTDLQKYLLADFPAAFLYFPYEYTIIRK